MSQLPPDSNWTPPYTPPPYTPPGYTPPGYGYPAYLPTRTSGSAITSLVLGLLFCIPGITSLGAIIFGLVGIRATARPHYTGRGMAIAGLVLGLLGLFGWGAVSVLAYHGVRAGLADAVVANAFFHDLAAGDTAAASAECVSGTTPANLQQMADDMKPLGTFRALQPNGYTFKNYNGSRDLAPRRDGHLQRRE